MSNGIAIIGIGCQYPDADTPKEFWENILAQRRSFRRIPNERLPLKDYYSSDRSEPDKTYSAYAALIHEFEFDRVHYRISGSTFRATDIAQWLALQVASDALADAGYVDGANIPKDTTGVILGNTLTGEVSRANSLRLRWPYVEKVIRKTLRSLGLPTEQQAIVLKQIEERYKSSFPAINHENLAGGLSNTIPGRICNHFDFHGGGYTVDGACAASLLAVTTACSQLESHDLDVAIAGGVDISLDPFELVGFAKMGAIAEKEMFVYDERSSGFLPGEGCGMIVLKRLDDAIKDGNRIYSVIRGWGISSDGQGGLTTPSTSGQAFAVRRAYQRAGYGIETVSLIEGHGTGTTVGDKIELAALASVLAESKKSNADDGPLVGVGSIKANIGHTKAAAGIAGLIKTTLALYNQVLPPMPGCERPYKAFQDDAKNLYPLRKAELWDKHRPLRAGVSAFGFGGINTHIALESLAADRRKEFSPEERRLLASKQDSEVFFFSAKRIDDLKALIEKVRSAALRISQAEMADLAATLALQSAARELRAAIVASHPDELHNKLERLLAILENNTTTHQFSHIDLKERIFAARGASPPKIGFLYPGQGTQQINMSSTWFERNEAIRTTIKQADAIIGKIDGVALSEYMFRNLDRCTAVQRDNWARLLTQTEIAQPAIVASSVATTKMLEHFGIHPSLAIGYSLGEWTALWSAGVLSEKDLFRCVAVRGRAMATKGDVKGAMATVAASANEVQHLLDGVDGYVVISGYNSLKQVVISGEADAVNKAVTLCRQKGFAAIPLKVSNAFHSALVSQAAEVLRNELASVNVTDPKHPVISTITGNKVESHQVREMLCKQILEPVKFMDAIQRSEEFGIEVFVEVGPGRSQGNILSDIDVNGVKSVLYTDDEGGTSFQSMNTTLGCLFAMGVPIMTERLYENRFTRPFSLDYHPRFIQNPCESISDEGDEEIADRLLSGVSELKQLPKQETKPKETRTGKSTGEHLQPTSAIDPTNYDSILNVVLDIASEITEYPSEVVKPEHLLLRDLNLNSIASAQLVAEVARRIGLPRPADVTEYSTASLQQIATTLFELASTKGVGELQEQEAAPSGISPWVHSFTVKMHEQFPPTASIVNLKEGHRCLVISDEQNPFASAFVDRLLSQGIEVDQWYGQSPEEFFESLMAVGKHLDAVVIVLPHSSTPEQHGVIKLLFATAKHIAQLVTEKKQYDLFVGLVQFGGGMFGRDGNVPTYIDTACGSGLMKSLYLEMNFASTCIIDFSSDLTISDAANIALTEFQRASGFVEVGYTADAARRVPVMRPFEYKKSQSSILTKDDVLLVTGGGRGIAVDCALAIARESGCKVVLLGRTKLDANGSSSAAEELRTTMKRFQDNQCVHRYYTCDVTDRSSVQQTIEAINKEFGNITAVLHAAGSNIPQAARNLTRDAIEMTLAPKLQGTENIVQTLQKNSVKMFLTFGSIIGQTGMRGECAYAFANEWMNLKLLQMQAQHPSMRCLSLNWSVWSGSGMGERLGSIDALMREGITPIEVEQGVKELLLLMQCESSISEILVTGRLGNVSTRTFGELRLPLLRFLEQPRVHYPCIEIIAECNLSAESDPYLADHLFSQRDGAQQGMQLFPAVFGMEAMVQVASVLTGNNACALFEKLEFNRPIMVPPESKTTIRLIAQTSRENKSIVDVAIRSSETKFAMDHFRGRCVFEQQQVAEQIAIPSIPAERLPLNPKRDLYGGMLFQGPMFQHLAGYRELSATSCLAEIESGQSQEVFGRYFPQVLLTGDPTIRDVFLHAIQPCVPGKIILPLSIEKILCFQSLSKFQRLLLYAVERERTEAEYVYDVKVFSPAGELVEVMNGFTCKVIGKRTVSLDGTDEEVQRRLPSALLGPYIERRLQEFYPVCSLSIGIDLHVPKERNSKVPHQVDENREQYKHRKQSSDKALSQAVRGLLSHLMKCDIASDAFKIVHQENDKQLLQLSPEFYHLQSQLTLSASHSDYLTLAIAGIGKCSCDIEAVVHRTDEAWDDLLAQGGIDLANVIHEEVGESLDISRTRVWTILECMKKTGMSKSAFPVYSSSMDDGWVVVTIGSGKTEHVIATQHCQLTSPDQDIVISILMQPTVHGSQLQHTIVLSQKG